MHGAGRLRPLQAAFGPRNYPDAMEHWFSNGEDEGRDGRS